MTIICWMFVWSVPKVKILPREVKGSAYPVLPEGPKDGKLSFSVPSYFSTYSTIIWTHTYFPGRQRAEWTLPLGRERLRRSARQSCRCRRRSRGLRTWWRRCWGTPWQSCWSCQWGSRSCRWPRWSWKIIMNLSICNIYASFISHGITSTTICLTNCGLV